MKTQHGGAKLFMVITTVFLGAGLLQAQVPTYADRVRDSGLNPSNCTWKAENIRIWPLPKLATNQPPLTGCFRYDFDLAAKPRQAAITLLPSRSLYWFSVNGKEVVAPELRNAAWAGVRNVDLLPHLKAGHNVLALRGGDGGIFYLVAEGMVFCEDGSQVRLLTNKRWRGGYNLPAGWDKPATDPNTIPPVDQSPPSVPVFWPTDSYGNPPYYGPIQVAPAGMREPIFDEEKPVELKVTVVNGAANDGEQKSENAQRSTPNVQRRMNTEAPAFPISAEGGSASGGNHKPFPILTYEIFDENSRKTMGQGAVELKPEGKLDLAGMLKYGPLPKGAYRFRFDLAAGTNRIDRRDYEVACVGEIKQRQVTGTHYEDGLELKEVWSMDCTTEPRQAPVAAEPAPPPGGKSVANAPAKPLEFVVRSANTGPRKELTTKVMEGPAGKYRVLCPGTESGSGVAADYFAYRFKVKKLFAPHLAVVEWPDDAARNFQVHIMEGTTMVPEAYAVKHYGNGWARGEAAVMSVGEHPLSMRMQKLHFIYWPNEEEEAIHIFDLGGAQPAAAAKITIFEIVNDIPALKIVDAGDRLIGYHTEQGAHTMASTYYSGPVGHVFPFIWAGVDHPEFYRNWYTTLENMIKRMRFSGQNLYVITAFEYTQVQYCSKRYGVSQPIYSHHVGDANKDYVGIVLRMLGRNGMGLISNFEYIYTEDLLEASPATVEEVRQGAPTLFCVGKNGSFAMAHGFWPGMNYFHPRVQESILNLVDELAGLYKDYPAWKGISFMLSRCFGPMNLSGWTDYALDWGYEDYTIDLFQKETRIRIPVDKKDPQRFQKRYDWLMANAKNKWIDWKCAKYTKLHGRIRDRLVKARPDLKLYLIDGEPLHGNKTVRPSRTGADWDYTDPAAMKQLLKDYGYDVDALKREPGIVTLYMFLSPGTRQSGGAPNRVYRDLMHSQAWNDLFANDGKGGAYIWSGFQEYHMAPNGGPAVFKPGEWVFCVADDSSLAYPWPVGEYLNDAFVNVFVRSNPTIMPHTWIDGNDPCGRLHEMRTFARAYRSLPNGKYTRLTGNGLDLNLWVETISARGAVYAYAANANWWNLDEVTLSFAAGVKVHDLIRDEPVKLVNNRWTFKLGPYSVQTFRIDGSGSDKNPPIVGAETILPKQVAAELDRRVAPLPSLLARAKAREADLRDLPGWSGVARLDRMILDMETLKKAGDMDGAHTLAASWQLEAIRLQLSNEVLEAMPFVVLGPFGKPEDTGPGGEVAQNYLGMETAWLGESDQPDCSLLKPGFAPDISKSCQVYPGKAEAWQKAVKTYFLTFFGKCHSEMPLWMVAYAATEIYSPGERDVMVWAGSDHALWIWGNGQRVLKHGGANTHRGGQRPSGPNQNKGSLHLRQGWNQVLLKAVQRGETRIFFRLTDSLGQPMDDLKFRAPQAG